MLHFWAALGRAMVDRYFWAGLENNCVNSNMLAEAQDLRNFLVDDLKLRLTRYEVMEINRIIIRDLDNNYNFKFLNLIRAHFRIDSIQFPRDLDFCAVLGHALVDEDFADNLYYHRNNPKRLKEQIARATKIELECADAQTIGRFFKTEVTRPPSSGSKDVAETYSMDKILQAANQALWVKPEVDSPFADELGTGSGQCGESPTNSDNYIHINGPGFREVLFRADSEDQIRLLRMFGIKPAETDKPDQVPIQSRRQPPRGGSDD